MNHASIEEFANRRLEREFDIVAGYSFWLLHRIVLCYHESVYHPHPCIAKITPEIIAQEEDKQAIANEKRVECERLLNALVRGILGDEFIISKG